MLSSTHSSQIKTPAPAISCATSVWLLPQNEQKWVLSFILCAFWQGSF